MNHLLRSNAPISDLGWRLLDHEAKQRLEPALAARRLVDFSGPLGWEHSGRARQTATDASEPAADRDEIPDYGDASLGIGSLRSSGG